MNETTIKNVESVLALVFGTIMLPIALLVFEVCGIKTWQKALAIFYVEWLIILLPIAAFVMALRIKTAVKLVCIQLTKK